MKDFEEFMSSLTKENISWLCSSDMEKVTIDFSDADALNDFVALISAHNFSMMQRFLKLYHKWLSEQTR